MIRLFAIALMAASPVSFAADTSPSADDEALEDITIRGRRMESAELEDSEPRAIIGKEEMLRVLKGQPPECKQGALSAGFESARGFVFEDGAYPVDAVVAELKQRRERKEISCFYVVSREYDRAIFRQLEASMEGGSLFWNEPERKDE